MTPTEQVRAKCNEVVALAKSKYNVDLSKVAITFNLKGRVAGWACARGSFFARTYQVKFNHDMITRGDPEVLADMINDTVPHELAHIVCFINPALGKNHDYGWASVCRGLGGTGNRTHDNEVVFGRGITYEYTTDRGNKVRLNERRHQHIQKGGNLTYNKGAGRVTQACAFSIVGHAGRTLQAPIVKKTESDAPDAAEMARRAAMIEELRRRQLETKEVPVSTFVLPPATPVQRPVVVPVQSPVQRVAIAGESKAATSRRIMLSGYRGGQTYEQIIQAMMLANGYDRQLARATFKANAAKVNIPANWGG